MCFQKRLKTLLLLNTYVLSFFVGKNLTFYFPFAATSGMKVRRKLSVKKVGVSL